MLQDQAVFEAIKRGDPDAARAAMQAHLDGLRRRILQGSDEA